MRLQEGSVEVKKKNTSQTCGSEEQARGKEDVTLYEVKNGNGEKKSRNKKR